LIQAKLKSLHEVVVRNRLELLRKRQRDEALQAQEELLAGVARSASRKAMPDTVPLAVPDEVVVEIEEYDRSMSPPLIDISKLFVDERDMEVLNEKEDRRNLVCLAVYIDLLLMIGSATATSCSGRFTIRGENGSTHCRGTRARTNCKRHRPRF
jgi:hypothetical protein